MFEKFYLFEVECVLSHVWRTQDPDYASDFLDAMKNKKASYVLWSKFSFDKIQGLICPEVLEQASQVVTQSGKELWMKTLRHQAVGETGSPSWYNHYQNLSQEVLEDTLEKTSRLKIEKAYVIQSSVLKEMKKYFDISVENIEEVHGPVDLISRLYL